MWSKADKGDMDSRLDVNYSLDLMQSERIELLISFNRNIVQKGYAFRNNLNWIGVRRGNFSHSYTHLLN